MYIKAEDLIGICRYVCQAKQAIDKAKGEGRKATSDEWHGLWREIDFLNEKVVEWDKAKAFGWDNVIEQ